VVLVLVQAVSVRWALVVDHLEPDLMDPVVQGSVDHLHKPLKL